jgi:DNA-3-methyladenine glycosylase II
MVYLGDAARAICVSSMRIALRHLRTADPVIGELIGQIGPYKIEYLEPRFDTLAKAIVYQQLSGKAAHTIYTRLSDALDAEVTPENVLKLPPARMRKLGLSKQKIAYIRDLAAHTRDGVVDFAALPRLDDDAVVETLTRVKGIGVWTAHMFLIFALRRPDVLPVGDLGIRAAVRKGYALDEMPTPGEIEERGRCWRPYATVASWYLWRSLESKAGM